MRILYVITKAEQGGAQIHVRDLIAHLPAGFTAVLATGEKGFLCDEAAKLGVPVRVVPGLIGPIQPAKDIRALLGLMKIIREETPDIVHAHTSKAGWLARFAGRFTRTPTVFTAHTWSFADGIPRLQRWTSVPLEYLAAMCSSNIVTVSEANRAMARRRAIGRSQSMVCIWNGVPDVRERACPGLRSHLTLITAARFATQKDHSLLLKALASVEGEWRLLLVGEGPTQVDVKKLACELGLAQRIEFLGARADVDALLACADLFILPTKWEGLPLSILEAMRAGLPVIATDVGGVGEAVQDGITGYLTPPGNAEQLRRRIQELICFPARLQVMGSAARRRYEEHFRIETMVQKTVSIYRKLSTAKVTGMTAESVKGLS